MRFRLATNGQGGQQLQQGIGSMFQAMAMGPLYAAQGAEEAQSADMKRQLMQSQIRQNDSQIGSHVAQAAIREQERKQLEGRPAMIDLMSATRAGMNVPEFRAGLSERMNGAPMVGPPMLQPAIPGVGPSGRTAQFDDAVSSLYAPAMASPAGHTNWDQMAQARGHLQQQNVLDQVLAGQTNAGRAGQAVAASKGTKMIDNIGDTGTGFNLFTGEGSTLNPALATLYGKNVGAQTNQRLAAAGASGAAAGASAALSKQRGEQTKRIAGGYLGTKDIVDEDTGEVSVVRIPTDAEPVTIGVKPAKGGTGADATNAKARNAVVASVEKDMRGANDAEIQAEVDRRLARRAPGKPAAPSAAAAAPNTDMTAANAVKADYKAGKLTREQATAKLRALGLK